MSHTEESFHNNDEKPVLRELHKEKIVPTHAAVSAVDSEAREALHTLQALNDVTEEERGRVLRKLDLILMPLLCGTFFLQFVDKQSLVRRRQTLLLLTITTDTKYVLASPTQRYWGQDYSNVILFFYIGQLVAEWPVNYLLLKFHMGRVTGGVVALWGINLAAIAAVQGYAGLSVSRCTLGMMESIVGPAMMLFTQTFYRRNEQTLRVGIWYTLQGFAIVCGGLIAYACGATSSPLAPWRKFFLVLGIVTTAWGLLLFAFLPSRILDTWWLSPRERQVALDRLRHEKMNAGSHTFRMEQIRELALDPNFYCFFFMAYFINWGPALNAFSPLLIKGMGYSGLQATLFNSPSGAFNMVAILSTSIIATKIKNTRLYCVIVCQIIGIIGAIMLTSIPNTQPLAKLSGVWLSACSPAGFTMLLSIVSNNTQGQTKRVFTNGAIFVAFCLGNIAGPQTFFARDAPNYRTGLYCVLANCAAAAVTAAVLLWIMRGENKRRDEEAVTNEAAKPDYDAEAAARQPEGWAGSGKTDGSGRGEPAERTAAGLADFTERPASRLRQRHGTDVAGFVHQWLASAHRHCQLNEQCGEMVSFATTPNGHRRASRYDVIVVGGGAAGVAAAYGAARYGVKVLLLEAEAYLGGAMTMRGVASFCGLYTCRAPVRLAVGGIWSDLEDRLAAIGACYKLPHKHNGIFQAVNPEGVKLVLDELCQDAGIDVLLHANVIGARRQGDRIVSIQVHQRSGRCHEFEAQAFVDASGDGDLAHLGGAAVRYGNEGITQVGSMATRLSGFSSEARPTSKLYSEAIMKAKAEDSRLAALLHKNGSVLIEIPNTNDYVTFLASAKYDALDVQSIADAEKHCRVQAQAYLQVIRTLPGHSQVYLAQSGPNIGTRESRHVICRYSLQKNDVAEARRFPDSVALGCWYMEYHSPDAVAWAATLEHIGGDGVFDIPLRCLQSVDTTNLFVAGRIVDADKMASASVRVMGTAL
ncbi:hypothetical protein EMMF5_004667 [Cystobasidiomycetes sp. EMM_F5]